MSQRFIVVFKDEVTSEQISKYIAELTAAGGQLSSRWDGGGSINGFSATIPETYLESLQNLVGDDLSYIEPDGIITTQ